MTRGIGYLRVSLFVITVWYDAPRNVKIAGLLTT